MASFLQGLGAFAGGIAPGVSAYADQRNQNQQGDALGNALSAQYGGAGTPQQPTNPITSLLSSLGITPQTQQPAKINSGPQLSPGPGTAQASPQPQAQPQQAAPPPQQQQPQPQAQPRPQEQPAGQGQPQGNLDLPTLIKHLVANGVTGHKLVGAVQQFVPMLNAQGLQQYRDTGLMLRAQAERDQEANRAFNRDPTQAGSTAQNRVATQGIASKRMEAVQQRFQTRMDAAADKLKNAKTDKEAVDAKKDLDKIAGDLTNELKSELAIVNTPGTSPEEQKAALAKASEIRQQLQDATDAAIKGRRSGGANGDQVGGMKGGEAKPEAAAGGVDVAYGPDGKPMKYKGTGDRSDPANWAPDGGQ